MGDIFSTLAQQPASSIAAQLQTHLKTKGYIFIMAFLNTIQWSLLISICRNPIGSIPLQLLSGFKARQNKRIPQAKLDIFRKDHHRQRFPFPCMAVLMRF